MNISYLHKYLSSECSDRERQMVEDWLNASDQNQKYFDALKLIWDVSPGEKIEVDTEAAWESVRQQSLENTKPISQSFNHRQQRNRSTKGSVSKRARVWAYSFAAAAVILIAFFFSQYMKQTNEISPSSKQLTQEIVTDRGQRTALRLLDGTRVHLNVDSQLEIPANYNSADRKVYLEGEAFFEVVSNPNKPFLVHTDEGVTKVLGTKFAVQAYPDENQIQVVVVEGKVSLGTDEHGTDHKVLTRNRRGVFTQKGNVEVSDISSLDQYVGWKAGKLAFHGASLYEVKHRLERWYDIEITLQNEFSSSRRLTASFEDEPMTEVLNVIALALDVKYKREDRKVTIYRDK